MIDISAQRDVVVVCSCYVLVIALVLEEFADGREWMALRRL